MTFTPKSLAERWSSTAEHVLGLIHAGQLEAFSISPPGSKRPRFRISAEAAASFERQRSNRPQPASQPTRAKRAQRSKVRFYS